MFVRFEVPGYHSARLQAWYVPTKALTTRPPRPAWDKAAATGKAWSFQPGERPAIGVPLDDPEWTSPAFLSMGEPLEVLAPGVVRTLSGHELWVDTFYVQAEDPLTTRVYATPEERVVNVRRFHEGRRQRESKMPLVAVPAAEVLARMPAGQPVVLHLEPQWLSEPRFAPDWFEPVGHTLTHPCEAPRAFEPGGTYRLDYTALGAWLPTREADVVAVWTGTVLAVQVVDPWAKDIGVTSDWAGSTP
jgi:hypothetical protein